MQEIYLTTRAEWRSWLSQHHDTQSGIWLVFYKKHTQMPSLQYDAVVEEALCFGWIDSIIKKLDEDRYVRKLTPRKPGSQWSELNIKRAKKLVREGLMTESGLATIEEAKKTGLWTQSQRPQIPLDVPVELKRALKKNKKANTFFANLAPTYQNTSSVGSVLRSDKKRKIDASRKRLLCWNRERNWD